jgi:hypothetical protein
MSSRIEYTNFKTKFITDNDLKKQDGVLFDYQKMRVNDYKNESFINKIKGTFMNMLIENYIKLNSMNFKFDIPKDIIEDKDTFIDDNNEVKTFLKAECELTNNEGDYITLKYLYISFIIYLKSHNIKVNIKEKEFKNRLSKIVPFKDRFQPTVKGKKLHLRSIFTNIKLIEKDNDEIEKDNDEIEKDKDNLFVND